MSSEGDQPELSASHRTSKEGRLVGGVPAPSKIIGPPPPGLEGLVPRKEVYIKQETVPSEGIVGFACKITNEYSVLDPSGTEIYSGEEHTNCCTRVFLGRSRPFKIVLRDPNQQLITIERSFRGSSCCCPCFLQKLKVYNYLGEELGSVVQKWSWWRVKFHVLSPQGDILYVIRGPCCTSRCCTKAYFKIKGPDEGETTGLISKYWNGMIKDIFPDEDNLSLNIPEDAAVETKAVLLGACVLIDFMYYKRTKRSKNANLTVPIETTDTDETATATATDG